MEATSIRTNETEVRDIPIDWDALEDAFENTMPEVRSYLHRVTGAILRVVHGVADPVTLSRLATDADYVRIEPVPGDEQYRWMEQFIPTAEDLELRQKLSHVIVGKGAFRRFKDVLVAYPEERERWFAVRSARLRLIMEAWLRAHHLSAMPKRISRPEAPSGPRPAPGPSGASNKSGKSPSARLHEIVDSLGPGDLTALTAFAEFIAARSRGEMG